jgi:hypothetical protein
MRRSYYGTEVDYALGIIQGRLTNREGVPRGEKRVFRLLVRICQPEYDTEMIAHMSLGSVELECR